MKTNLNYWKKSQIFRLNLLGTVLTLMLLIALPACENDDSTSLNDEVGLKASNTTGILYFGHKTFTRGTGTPVLISSLIENSDFEHFDDNFVLYIQNGKDSKTRVSSAEIWIDGNLVVGPSDFSKKIAYLTKQLHGITPESILEVKLNSSPGSYIDLWIEGSLKPGHALIGTDGGTLESEDKMVHIEFPANALNEPIILSTETVDIRPNDVLYLNNNFTPVFSKVIFTPDETFFNELVKVTIKYNDLGLTLIQEQHLYFVQILENALIPVRYTEIDTDNNLMTAYLEHFSEYTVGYFFNNLISYGTEVAYDALYGFHWDVDKLKIYIAPDTDHYLWDAGNRVSLVKEIINDWEKHQGRFEVVYVANSAAANIIIKPTPRIAAGSGRTIIPIKPFRNKFTENDQVTIEILSTSQAYSDLFSLDEALVTIVGHEMGHALGLAHTAKAYSNIEPKGVPMMWISFFRSINQLEYERIITGADIIRLQHLYGKPDEAGIYKNEFSSDLSDWIPIDGSWQIQNGLLLANYGISCGSIFCPQGDLILKDQFQPSGDWRVSVDFTHSVDNSYSYSASAAGMILWISPNRKLRIGVGNGGFYNWGNTQLESIGVGFGEWDGTWYKQINKEVNYIWNPKDWHTMTVEKTGNIYKVYVNDVYLWEYTDTYLNGSGKIGLQTYGPKTYDNFVIRTNN